MSDTVVVLVIDTCFGSFVPNAFSPNDDDVNDWFRPIGINGERFRSLEVFNRWGEKLFESGDINQGWDGNFGNIPQELGVYVYVIRVVCKGNVTTFKGNVTLLR